MESSKQIGGIVVFQEMIQRPSVTKISVMFTKWIQMYIDGIFTPVRLPENENIVDK